MKKGTSKRKDADMLPEYDFRHGVRGKHAKRYAEGTNIVMLDPVVSKFFPTSESVNTILRALVGVLRFQKKKAA
jgi:hypothetical protein